MRDTGIEPVTSSVSGKRSPAELNALKQQPKPLKGLERGADDETRTRDPHLGKVMRYQLRYIRIRDGDALKKRCIFAATTNTSLLGSQFTNHQVDRPFRRCALTHTAGTELQHCNSGQQVTAAVCVHPGKPRAMPCELNSCSFGSARRQVVTFFPSG